jgi:hypothetical protein
LFSVFTPADSRIADKRLFENFENLVLRSRFVRNGVSKGGVFKEKSSILRDGAIARRRRA